MAKLSVEVISQMKNLFTGEADSLTVTTPNGTIMVLPDHAPLVTLLDVGEIVITTDKKKHLLAGNGGILTVKNNTVKLLANQAVPAIDILKQEVENAIEQAEHKKGTAEQRDLIQLEKIIRFEKLKKKVSDSLRE